MPRTTRTPPLGASTRLIGGTLNINTLLAFAFGVLFVSAMLGFAVGFPNPTPFQFNVFIVVLALAAGGVGSVLPGTLSVNLPNLPAVRAGGAIAMFVLVLVFRPVIQQTAVQYKEPPGPAQPIAESYLSLWDDGKVHEAWAALDPEAQGVVVSDEATLKQLYDSYRKPLGAALSRQLAGTNGANSPSGSPIGLYRIYSFRTKFAGTPGECRGEYVTLRATQELQWKPFSYQISPTAISCV
jgi:hypothetical protein